MAEPEIKRLNWGSGTEPPADWINCDVKEAPGIDISCDIRGGLPLEDDSIDYAASIHAFPELPCPDVEPAMAELRRVLRPGGVLRLALPDMEKAMNAYRGGDADYFLIPHDDVRSIGGKLIVQLPPDRESESEYTLDFTPEMP